MLKYFLLFPFLYSCFQLVAYVRAYEGEQREKENKQKTKEIQIKAQAKSQEGKWHSPLTLLYFCFNFFWFRKLLVSIHKVLFFLVKVLLSKSCLCLKCCFSVELQPTFSSQPSNPSTVEEGGDLILQWNYNLDSQSHLATLVVNVTAGALQNVATRLNDDNATVEAGYENLFRATITDTQARLTILAVPKSINGEKYQLRMLTASPNFFTLQSDDVKISVLCK